MACEVTKKGSFREEFGSDDVDEDISFSTAYKALFGSKRRKHLLEVLPRFESWQVACQDSPSQVDKDVVV